MALKIHHLNCGTMCPYGRRLFTGTGGFTEKAEICCHVLLVETDDGLVLVDTGIGSDDIKNTKRLGLSFLHMSRPVLDMEETALYQVRRLGFKPEDVRHIVLTHLDPDHAGGLSDFPDATVHVFKPEHHAATVRPSLVEKSRYRPLQLAHQPHWQIHELQGETWKGFDSIRALPGSKDEILLIPLIGHTHGHCGIAINTGNNWLLHCGDAYFHRDEMIPHAHSCPPGFLLMQNALQMDGAKRRHNQGRLRELVCHHGKEVDVFCAHDTEEFARHRR